MFHYPPITICIAERKLNKSFDSDEQAPKLPTNETYAKVFYHVSPNFQFEKLRLNELFKQCLETAFFFEKNIYNKSSKVRSSKIIRNSDWCSKLILLLLIESLFDLKSLQLMIKAIGIYHYIIVLMLKLQ